jgi:hypothetical protein
MGMDMGLAGFAPMGTSIIWAGVVQAFWVS